MSHFAELDKNNVVLRVIVAEQDFIDKIKGRWVQTSYNGKIRGCYAGIGYVYDQKADRFVPPKAQPENPVISGNVSR